MSLIVPVFQVFLVQWAVWDILTSMMLDFVESYLITYQLGNISSLRYLNLGCNFGLYVDNLHWMSSLSSIRYLDLSSVDLHREVGWLQIMSKFPTLSELFLQYCHLDSLNTSLASVNFTSLRVLYLSENHFNHEITNWFSNLSTSLLWLYLAESSLTGGMPPSIFHFQKLEYIDLKDNSLSRKIPNSLGQLKHLTWLQLSYIATYTNIPSGFIIALVRNFG